MKSQFFLKLLVAYCITSCQAQMPSNNGTLKLITSIALPGVKGRIDHLAYDSTHQIVFVAALGNNTVEVVDLKKRAVVHSITNLHEPQGILFIPESNKIFIANGSGGECDAFDANTFQKTISVKLPGDADNIRYEADTKKIYVGYGDGGIAVIDAITFKLMHQIRLDAHPESFQIDKSSERIYANVPDEKQIEIVDLRNNVVLDKWKISEAASNFPMALDGVNHRLFIGCRHPAKLLVIDTQTGKSISALTIDGDADDIFYNPGRKEIYISCGSGYVDVFKQTDADTYIPGGKVPTRPGARTSMFMPGVNQLVVAAPSHVEKEATLYVYAIK